jgi:3-methyl-2-oxobutanoate hydroxymethyltransferase
VQRDAPQLLADARAAEQAGAFAMVLECIPRGIAKKITQEVAIPTIGIGAGADCDGQVLVLHDLLGITSGYVPRFVKAYADMKGEITRAVTHYRKEVRDGTFPAKEHGYD